MAATAYTVAARAVWSKSVHNRPPDAGAHHHAAFERALHAESHIAFMLLFALGLQGGASTQFSAIPLNLAAEGAVVDYIVTGSWSKKAAGGEQRAQRHPPGTSTVHACSGHARATRVHRLCRCSAESSLESREIVSPHPSTHQVLTRTSSYCRGQEVRQGEHRGHW